MTIRSATPYLLITDGRAEQAIELYKRALGASVETLRRHGDVDPSCSVDRKQQVMHAVLRVGQATLMISDDPSGKTSPDSTILQIALDLDDEQQARSCFAALSESGTVLENLMQAPWGALFGALRDAYGVHWMFNCELKPA